jgi:hypothetical protein
MRQNKKIAAKPHKYTHVKFYVHKAILSYPACDKTQDTPHHGFEKSLEICYYYYYFNTIKFFCFCSEFSTLMIPSVSDIIAKFRTAHK